MRVLNGGVIAARGCNGIQCWAWSYCMTHTSAPLSPLASTARERDFCLEAVDFLVREGEGRVGTVLGAWVYTYSNVYVWK